VIEFLARLAADGPVEDRRVGVVVAHYDDETLSVAAVLQRCAHVTVIHATDGGHPDPRMWMQAGARTLKQYLRVRAAEVVAAAEAGGWAHHRHIGYGLPDRAVVRHLRATAAQLRRDLADVDVVLTHPYEGGHPDHDALAWLIREHAAGHYEFASYHLGPQGKVVGRFWDDPACPALTVPVVGESLQRKQAAAAAYASQHGVVAWFDLTQERYRRAPTYDFTAVPPPGRCLYERKRFMMSADWRALVREQTA